MIVYYKLNTISKKIRKRYKLVNMWEVKMQEFERQKFESYIGMNRSWWVHYNQYRNAVILLMNSVNGGYPIDRISLPIFFQIRHSLELGLKANILELEKINIGVTKIKFDGKSHDISILNQKLKEHFSVLEFDKFSVELKSEFQTYQSNLDQLVDKFDFLDKRSYSFRYPLDRNSNPVFKGEEHQNLFDFVELYKKVDTFFLFTLNVLDDNGIIEYN